MNQAVAPIERQRAGLHRYCAGCASDTEHVAWVGNGPGSVDLIRWPTDVAPSGTTICLSCGQWRAAASRPL
jgi:hypothetical protein